MPDYKKIKAQAETFFKQKQHAQAEAAYQKLFDEFENQCNRYDALHYVQAAKNQKKYKVALDLCRRFYPNYRDFEPIRNLYAWSIYYTQLRNAADDAPPEQIKKAALAVSRLSRPDDKYAPYNLSLLKAAEHKAFSSQDRIELTDCLTPEHLSGKSFEFTGTDRRTIKYPSELERFMVCRAKALQQAGRNKSAIQLIDEAFDTIKPFHLNNHLWLMRLKAKALKAEGNTMQALETAERVAKQKPDWYLLKELAEMQQAAGQTEKALQTACKAALKHTPPDKKVNLYALLTHLCDQNGKPDWGDKHCLWEYRIRSRQSWKTKPETRQRAEKTAPEYEDDKRLHKALKEFWKSMQPAGAPRIHGRVDKIFDHGGSGFIRGDNKKSYYFRMSDCASPKRMHANARVAFRPEKSYDKKKNKAGRQAYEIKIID